MHIMALPPGMAKQFAREAREGKAAFAALDGYAVFYRNRQEIAVIGWHDEMDTPRGYMQKLNTREWEAALAKSNVES